MTALVASALVAAAGCGGDDGDESAGDAGTVSDAAVTVDGWTGPGTDAATEEDAGAPDAGPPPMPDHWLDGEWDVTETSGEILGESFEFTNGEVTIAHDDDSLDLTARTLTANLSSGGTRSSEFAAAAYTLDGTSVLREGVMVGTLSDGVLSIEDCADDSNCKHLTITYVDPDRLAYAESQITAGTTQAAGVGVLRRRGSYTPASLSIVDTTPEVSPGLLESAVLVLEVESAGTEWARRMVASASGSGTLVPPPDGATGTPCADELAPGDACHLYLELGPSGSSTSATVQVGYWTVGISDVASLSISRSLDAIQLEPDLGGIVRSRLLYEISARTSDIDGDVLVVGAGQYQEY